jgi:Holliday junction DNA helicase RuvA
MIATLEGILSECQPLQIVVTTGGIGYSVNIPLSTMDYLPSIGKTVKLFTYVAYREDSQTLYGFHDKATRELFKLFIEKVSGIGPKTALGILSHLSPSTLSAAVAQENIALLSKCPGIGKKTAERLVLELKDTLGKFPITNTAHLTSPTDTASTTQSSNPSTSSKTIQSSHHDESTTDLHYTLQQDAIAALMTLGYKLPDADKAVRKALTNLGTTATTAQLIKAALNN